MQTGVAGRAVGPEGRAFETRDISANGGRILVSPGSVGGSLSREATYAQTVGSMAHELAHAFSLPDLYDVEYTGPDDDSAGIGRWGLMGWGAQGWSGMDGPNRFSAWSLEQLGWIGPDGGGLMLVDEDAPALALADRLQGGSVLKIPLHTPLASFSKDRDDYLLLERRSRSASHYGRNMPGDGVLVWHVRAASDNAHEQDKLVDLLCADGRFSDAGYPQGSSADADGGLDNLDFWAHDQAHAARYAGNMGDATDPFDGVRFRELSLATNPSTSPGSLVPGASSGLSVGFWREGEQMWVDVKQPRWSGVIERPTRWRDRVLVEGDVTVDPAGSLTIEAGAQVLFTPGDATGGGIDPQRSELDIRGSFQVKERVTFAALDTLHEWYGIVLEPAPGSAIDLRYDRPPLSKAVSDSLVMPRAPPEWFGKVEIHQRIVDGGPGTIGNGDGRPAPEETFRVEVQVTNWTGRSWYHVESSLRWSSPLVKSLDGRGSAAFDRFHMSPAVPLTLLSPPLRLSSQATEGGEIDFTLTLTSRTGLFDERSGREIANQFVYTDFDDTTTYQVSTGPQYSASLSTGEGVLRVGESIRAPVGEVIPVEATLVGDVREAQLIVYRMGHLEPLQKVPLQPADLSEERTFAGELTLPEPGLYEVHLSVTDGAGAVAFGGARLSAWAHDDEGRLPVLVFMQPRSPASDSAVVADLVDQLPGRTLEVVTPIPTRADVYDALLPHYYNGGLVLWLEGTLSGVADAKLRTLLEEGGNLLVMTHDFDVSRKAIVQDKFHVDSITRVSQNILRTIIFTKVDTLSISRTMNALQLRSPARPLFLVGADQVTGSYVNDGTYRGVLLPFSINAVPQAMRRPLLEEVLTLLSSGSIQAELEIEGKDHGSLIAVPVDEPVQVTARIDGEAAGVNLIAYPLVAGETHLTIPMQRVSAATTPNGDETVFEAAISLVEGRRYVLVPIILDAAGNRQFSPAQLGLIGYRRDVDALVLFNSLMDEEELRGLRSSMDNVMDRLGWQASFVRENDAQEYAEPLLRRFGETGKTIVSFADANPGRPSGRGVRQVLSGTSKMLIIVSTHVAANQTDPFTHDVLRVSSHDWPNTQRLSTAGLLAGADIDAEIYHQPFHLLPPAVPLIVNEDGYAGGWYVRDGPMQLAYLAVSLKKMLPSDSERLVEETLRLLQRDTEVELSFPGSLKAGNYVIVQPGDRIEVTATSMDPVSELVMWSSGDRHPVEATAMVEVRDGTYRGSIVVPGEGLFIVAARVAGRRGNGVPGGPSRLAGQSVHVLARTDQAGVLAFLPDEGEAGNVSTDLRTAVAQLGLKATIVRERIFDLDLLDFLLERNLDTSGIVVWGSDSVMETETAALKAYLERGGHLMLASQKLPATEWGAEFLHGMLGITEIGNRHQSLTFNVGRPDEQAVIRIRGADLAVDASAQAFLRDTQDRISGVKKSTGIFRAVFLPLALSSFQPRTHTTSTPLADLLESGLRYLSQELDGPVGISTVRAPAYARIGPLRPEIVVTNDIGSPTADFRVGFEISIDDSVVASFEQVEASLPPGAERVIALDDWRSTAEDEVVIRIGVGWLDGELTYQPPQTVHVLDVQDRFGQLELPAATGAGFFDYDGDGDEDLYLTRPRGQQNILLKNHGSEGFANTESEVGLEDEGGSRGMAVADYDGDGDLDLYLVNEEANRLFHNTGTGGFIDATAAASAHAEERSLADESSGRSAGFFDGDGDGDLDLYLVNAAAPNRYYENEDRVFFERASEVGLDEAGDGRALTFGDYDGDADVDLFVANQDGDALLRNDSGRYVEVHAAAGITSVVKDVGCVFGDYDNDGDLDLFIANQESANRLYRNRGDGTYEEATGADLHLGTASVGSAFGDFDSDGDLDLATSSLSSAQGGDEIYHNIGHGSLVPVSSLLELNPHAPGRALSLADVDGDGDQDLFVAHASGTSVLYVNSTQNRNWLQVVLQDVGPNPNGLGAVVELISRNLRQRRTLQPSFGYLSHGPAEAHFGLGDMTSVDTLRVHWPDGHQTEQADLDLAQLNQRRVVLRDRPTAIASEANPVIPTVYRLGLGYPNPFNARVTIPVDVPRESTVHLEVFNISGQRVRSLIQDVLLAGTHRIIWNGRDANGQLVGTGVYILRMQAGEFQQAQRVLLLK